MEELKLALFFALPPNLEGLCGKRVSERQIPKILESEESIKNFLLTFPVLKLYLFSLASYHQKKWYEQKIIEAYIIGNDYSFVDENFFEYFRKELSNIKIVNPLINQKLVLLREILKKQKIPITHNFHVLYFQSFTIPPLSLLNEINKCITTLASYSNREWRILTLKKENGYVKLYWSKAKINFPSYLDFELKEGYYFVHRNNVFCKANKSKIENFEKCFKEIINLVNKYGISKTYV